MADGTERIVTASWLTINQACNLRCQWCYAKMTGYNNKDMSMELVNRSAHILKDLGLKSVILIGGEPTLHPLFLRIVDAIKNTGLNVYLVTNAILFENRNFLQESINAGISSITVSFKSPTSTLFYEDTGTHLYDQAIKGLENIIESKINYVVNVTACQNMLKYFSDMLDLMRNLRVKVFSVDTGKPIFLQGAPVVNGMGTPKEMAKFFQDIYQRLANSSMRFSLKIAIPFCLFPRAFIDRLIEDGNILTGCQMMNRKGLVIASDGNILPCNHLCDLSLGKIGEDFKDRESFIEYRHNKNIQEFYKTVGGCPTYKCTQCDYWQYCGGGCKLYWLHYSVKDLLGQTLF